VKVARLLQHDYRPRRRVEKQASHVDLGTLGDTHDPGPRCVGSQHRKDLRWNDLKLRSEVIVHFGSEDAG
jgi:hypothetical protein